MNKDEQLEQGISEARRLVKDAIRCLNLRRGTETIQVEKACWRLVDAAGQLVEALGSKALGTPEQPTGAGWSMSRPPPKKDSSPPPAAPAAI